MRIGIGNFVLEAFQNSEAPYKIWTIKLYLTDI